MRKPYFKEDYCFLEEINEKKWTSLRHYQSAFLVREERGKYLHLKDWCAFYSGIQRGMNLGRSEPPPT